jgi:uncharacterized protein (TIGR02421 family)
MSARSYLHHFSDAIVHAQRPIRILKALNWDPQVHVRFFRQGATELPEPVYAPLDYDPADKVRELVALRRQIRGRNTVEAALRRKCDEFVEVVRLLAARGTKRFYHHSVRLYGSPRQAFRDSGVDNLEIARLWASRPMRPGENVERRDLTAEHALEVIGRIVRPVLGEKCRLKISTRLTADAAAGATSIAVRKDARFSRRQARALAHHEGLWHVLTSVNGYQQPVLTVLGVGLARFATSQEGAGVVAEYLSGNMSSDRLRELGERALAVDMAAQGASYLDVFRYLAHRFPAEKAAQMSERVFRGGVLGGGAPFTKDAIYQRGYCRVFNFIRHAVEHAELDLLQAFFSGKMSVDDAPLVAALIHEGLVVPAKHLPGWARDLEALGAEVTHAHTMSKFDVGRVSRYYERLAAEQVVGLARWSEEVEDAERRTATVGLELPPVSVPPHRTSRAERKKKAPAA